MPLARRLRLAFTIWLVLEALVFIGVAHEIGIGWAILAGLATTILGAVLLKRAGKAAMVRLRATLQGRAQGRRDSGFDEVLDGTLAALAAAALILPGFLSDALGVALAIPPLRARFGRWVRGGGLGIRVQRAGPHTIDLEPDEWRHTRPPEGELLR